MKILIGTVAMIGAVVLPVPAALACVPLAYVDQNGETYPMNSPRGWAREQAAWRARAEAVFLAQVSAVRLARGYSVAFTFTPIAPLYDTPLPDPVPMLRRDRGNTCNEPLEVGDYVVVYADQTDGAWTVVGFAPLGRLQDRPPGIPTERDLSRGLYPLPDYPE
jgi:hypothetical protein